VAGSKNEGLDMTVTVTRRAWMAAAAAIVVVGVVAALILIGGDDDGGDVATDATTSTSDTTQPATSGTTGGPATSTTAPTSATTASPGTTASGFATAREVAADRYGRAYLGGCEAVPPDGQWGEDALCSVDVTLSATEVVLMVGPPYSEVIEDLLVRRSGDMWAVADTYAVPELGVDDPDMPDWVRTAMEIKDGTAA
jgi:hypothetical protein